MGAAAYATQSITCADFADHVRSVARIVVGICADCGRRFEREELPRIIAAGPHDAEEAVYGVRAAIARSRTDDYVPPPLADVVREYRSAHAAAVREATVVKLRMLR